eukprot:comp20158_c0_seq1/m.24941 comp20158_c0_seq1/g.24941  ORF comp20158_c0_seq1/g.24941 comp20158_c0_seq1/m.24941 type:complete len:277 (-) comp20158_c0_seq1:161-991(-)
MQLGVYLRVNGLVAAGATAAYLLLQPHTTRPWLAFFTAAYAVTLLKHVLYGVALYLSTCKKQPIRYNGAERQKPSRTENLEMLARGLFIVFVTESVDLYFGYFQRGFNTAATPVWLQALLFVPHSLLFELVFDLGHYWAHRLCHDHRWLYRSVHKLHHRYLHPTLLATYMHDAADIFLSNFLPFVLALYVVPKFSEWQFHLMLGYKAYIELAGHTGVQARATTFPQFPHIMHLGIAMHTNDHDLHHTSFSCNYSKRFVLWDKVFGTYKVPPTQGSK